MTTHAHLHSARHNRRISFAEIRAKCRHITLRAVGSVELSERYANDNSLTRKRFFIELTDISQLWMSENVHVHTLSLAQLSFIALSGGTTLKLAPDWWRDLS